MEIRKENLQGLRLVNKMTKSDFGKSNGGKITTWMIKYPHIKKNAQRPKHPLLQGSRTVKYYYMIKVLLICVLMPLAFAVTMALISHWRDGTWHIHITPRVRKLGRLLGRK